MIFWLTAAAMAIVVAAAILRPLLVRRNTLAEPPAAYDLRVYRDQLREVERDLARRVLTTDEGERLKTEIGRKILDADRSLSRQTAPRGDAPSPLLAGAVLGVLLVGAAALYFGSEGRPAMADGPLKARIAAAEAKMANRPSQAEAEAKATPAPPQTPPDPQYLQLIDQLRAAVSRRPDDPQGLALLAEHEGRLGNFTAAREAQARLVAVRGDQADAMDHARLAGLMVEAAGGVVTKEAEAELDRALGIDPRNGQALYFRGLMFAQNDRPDLAFPIWRDLLERGPADAPWMAPVGALMPQLAWLAGHPSYQPPEAARGPMPGDAMMPDPDSAAIAAAGDMTPEERQQMIAGMVQQLEARLAAEGGTPEEWARLITSLVRIGNETHAREIWGEAQTRFATAPEAMAVVRQAAESVGLTEGAAPPGDAALPGPDAAAVAAAGQLPAGDQQQMIEGMVAQLENRLTTQGGTGAEWGRLVNSLMVLGDRDKAATMLVEGRTALASDAEALAVLNAMATDAGVPAGAE